MSEQTQAETVDESTQQETPPAGSQEPLIPKYRYDEVMARLRLREEELEFKNRALEQTRPQASQEEEDYDQFGIDKNQVAAFKSIVAKEAQKLAAPLRNALGVVASKNDELQLAVDYGKDVSKYLPRIRQMRQEHAAQGTFLSAEMAYKFIRLEEYESKANKALEKPVAQEKVQAPAAKVEEKPPAASATQKNPQPMSSIEDMEAQLEEKFAANGPI